MLNQDRSLRGNTDKDGVKHTEKTNAPAMAKLIDNAFVDSGSSPPTKKVGRNALCHCGSGKKYKKCCLLADEMNSGNVVGAMQFPEGKIVQYTRLQAADFMDETNVARHEAAHALAAWLLGLPLHYVRLNKPGEVEYHSDELAGGCAAGAPLPEIWKMSIGERWVQARKQALMTLAGPFWSGDSESSNPLRIEETSAHGAQAVSRFMTFLSEWDSMDDLIAKRPPTHSHVTVEEAVAETIRLLNVVQDIFCGEYREQIRGAIAHLAAKILELHHLDGADAESIIEEIYPVLKEARENGMFMEATV
jgi:SEC-C motif-containing protein